MIIVAFILSILVTAVISKVLFRNTIGTTAGYGGRIFVIWLISFALIAGFIGAV